MISAGALGFEFNSMKNTKKQRELPKGKPLPFHERPRGRPFGNDLGRRTTTDDQIIGGICRGNAANIKASPPRKFSWEQDDA